ncbi:PREDICTED: epididymal-specific lipocalin-12 isoform X4 [Propithecus coquereli]|uniref:epididymal-specific lipocalin-12 isoform X4 n=1 Tax=Propithecus coquereli TaxID=379532 RepID=UPI00063FA606|nr:PREDICTED: epididymal-specific lipocalin-12 isoform X4 [Propithecus coquereli]
MSLGAPPAWWERQGAACSRKYLQDLAGWQPRWNSHAHPHRHIRQEERHRSCQRWGRRPHPLSSPGGSRTGSRCTVSSSAQGCPEACPDPGAEGQEVARMGPWCALWLLLTLPDVLWGQVLNPLPVQLGMQSFQGDQVSNAMTRGRRCHTWSYEMIPEAQPGQFAVEHGSGPGTDREEIQVVDSDYTSFALVLSRRPAGSLTIIRVSLLGRSWVLPQGTVDKFICLGRTHGLSEDNIAFPNLAGNRATSLRGGKQGGARGP